MIQVEVCSNCNMEMCDFGQGIDIYEEFKQYEELFIEKGIEFSSKECECLRQCKGPVVRVNGKVYIKVDEDKVEAILNELLE